MMRRKLGIFVGLLLLTGTALPAWAVPPGMVLEFGHSLQGKVIFDGSVHQQAGYTCADCHNDWLFPKMDKQALHMTMDDLREGRYCGACHNGDIAFGIEENCSRCHISP